MNAPAGRRWASIKEAALYLGMAAPAVYRLAYTKQLPCARLGRSWRVDMKALEELLERQAKVKP